MTPNEKKLQDRLVADGWEVIHTGLPDFFILKDGEDLRAVEHKSDGGKARLPEVQEKARSVLERGGIPVYVLGEDDPLDQLSATIPWTDIRSHLDKLKRELGELAHECDALEDSIVRWSDRVDSLKVQDRKLFEMHETMSRRIGNLWNRVHGLKGLSSIEKIVSELEVLFLREESLNKLMIAGLPSDIDAKPPADETFQQSIERGAGTYIVDTVANHKAPSPTESLL